MASKPPEGYATWGEYFDEYEDTHPIPEGEEPYNGVYAKKLSEVQARKVDWVPGYQGYIPLGGLTALMGEPGCNKSTLLCLLAAQITNADQEAGAGFIANEDGWDLLKPRLEAAGADLARCYWLGKKVDGEEDTIVFPSDAGDVFQYVSENNIKFLGIDPFLSHLDETVEANDKQSILRSLHPITRNIKKLHIPCVLVVHMNKGESMNPYKRIEASQGLSSAVRSALIMGVWPEEVQPVPFGPPQEETRRVLASFKSSWGKQPTESMLFQVADKHVQEIEDTAPILMPFGDCRWKASDLLKPKKH